VSPVAECRLHEREQEQETIAAVLHAARDGDGALLVIEGEPGIGKSSLLAWMAERADGLGFRVLGARGS
jgi:predicted ATPase